MAMTAMQAAKLACEASGWTLTNLSLHKLLYIAHAVHLGEYGEPLIEEPFEAWMYGPVQPGVYHRTKMYGAKPIKNIFRGVPDADPRSTEAKTVRKAVEKLGGVPANHLVSVTHWDDGAWAKNYQPRRNRRIPTDDIIEEVNRRRDARTEPEDG